MVFSHLMESGEVKAEQRQPVLPPKKRRKRPKPEKSSAQANGRSSSSAAESSLTRTPSSSPPSGDADGKGQQQHHEQGGGGGGGKRPRLVWTAELHDLFMEAYDSLGDEAVPRRILEKMNVPGLSREKVASHLQKHKLHLRRLAEEASGHSPTERASASHPLRSLPTNTTPLAQIEPVQVLPQTPPDYLSRSSSSSSSIAANIQSIQQQFLGPPIKEGQAQAQPAETLHMQIAPADSGFSPVAVGMETSTAAILVPEANTEEAVIRMVQQAAEAENAAEPEEAAPAPAPAPGSILGQFWASPDNEASCTSSWDIFVLSSRGT